MKIVVAPATYKGTIAAVDAAAAIARGVRAAGATAVECPVADGGGGTLDALIAGAGGSIMGVIARGPLGIPVRAHLGRLADGTGVVELAQASGLALVPERERDVMRASSQGTGELIKGALARRPHTVIVGLGDSATVDGGMGLGKGLGLRFLDSAGKPIGDGGGALVNLARIDTDRLDERVSGAAIIVAADVDAPLLGPAGAAAIFGPQKGATPDQVAALERGLQILAERLAADLGCGDVTTTAGSGAAGGCGAMLISLGATVQRGSELVLARVGLRAHLEGATLVITGEGTIDDQTMRGKAPGAVLQAALEADVPCVAISGTSPAPDAGGDFTQVRSLEDHFGDLDAATAKTEEGLEQIARRLAAERLRAV